MAIATPSRFRIRSVTRAMATTRPRSRFTRSDAVLSVAGSRVAKPDSSCCSGRPGAAKPFIAEAPRAAEPVRGRALAALEVDEAPTVLDTQARRAQARAVDARRGKRSDIRVHHVLPHVSTEVGLTPLAIAGS